MAKNGGDILYGPSKRELALELERLRDQLDKPPTMEEMNQFGIYDAHLFHQSFGDRDSSLKEIWQSACEMAEIELPHEYQ